MTKLTTTAAVLSVCLIACGANEPQSETTTANAPAVAESGESPSAPPAPAGPIDFSAADLDLYERGFAKEVELVRAAGERAAKAATPAERGAAMQAQWEDQSIPAAARAAAVPEDRYRHTRQAVHDVFETLDFQGKIEGPLSMDLSMASEETKARLAKDPFTALTPAAAEALRARMDRLVPVWIEYVRMTAVAG